MNPPRHAEALIHFLLIDDDGLRDGMLGDMTEAWSVLAASHGASNADRWYWRQVVRSVPALFALKCETMGLRRVIMAVMFAIVARIVMQLVQYIAITIAAVVRSGHPGLLESLVAATGCVGAAVLCGRVVWRVGGRDSVVAVGALCVAAMILQIESTALIHAAMPTWLYWVSTGPLSAIAVVVGATTSGARTA